MKSRTPNLSVRDENDGKVLRIDTPEERLVYAVIIQAISDCIDPRDAEKPRGTNNRNVKAAALKWLRDKSNDEPWSLMWALSHITTKPEALYEALYKFVETNISSSTTQYKSFR